MTAASDFGRGGFSVAVATVSALAGVLFFRSHRGSGADTFDELCGPVDRKPVSAFGSSGIGGAVIMDMSMTGAASEPVMLATSTTGVGGEINSPEAGKPTRSVAIITSGGAN